MANYQAMTNKELINLCKERGLATSGSKPVLIARLTNGVKTEAEVVAEVKAEENKPSEFAINAMRPALIAAHKLNNKKAISSENATHAGVSDYKFKEWLAKVEALRQAVAECNELRHKHGSTVEQIKEAEGKIYPAWRKVAECGASNADSKVFHKKWFIRETDVPSFIGFDESFYATEMGTQMGHATPTVFRKHVEALIGWRITGNDMLSDNDRDDILEFEKAKKGILSADNKLNGYMNGDEHVKGLIEKIADMENQIKTIEDTLRSLGQSDNEIAESVIVAPFRVQLKALKGEKEQTEKSKVANEETVRKLEKRAEEIYALLKPIEE